MAKRTVKAHACSNCSINSSVTASSQTLFQHTLGKLGEFLRSAMGLSSDNGRLCANDMFLAGDEGVLFVPFCTRSGGTCAHVRLDAG